ncbi:CbiX/SirB N-terminal domain-containing protein [Streptomyces sp. ODS28]|uniref:sirohydrochlorin chelatase n=1 Tax=Streptomyces sp. ODS28 TaxID=3136688 RepID=UPI0031F00340
MSPFADHEGPGLLAVAPAASADVDALLARVRALRPRLRVEHAYFGRHGTGTPSLRTALERGRGPRVVVPLFLGEGYDVVAGLSHALRPAPGPVRVAPPLAPDPLLVTALRRRLREAESAAGGAAGAVVLAGAGSRRRTGDEGCCTSAHMLAARLRHEGRPVPVRPAYLSGALGAPGVEGAVRELRAQGRHRVAVLPYLVTAGRFGARLTGLGGALTAGALGGQEALARLVLARYDAALDGPRSPREGAASVPPLPPHAPRPLPVRDPVRDRHQAA